MKLFGLEGKPGALNIMYNQSSGGGSSATDQAYPVHMTQMHQEFLAGREIDSGYVFGTFSDVASDTEAARAENGGSPFEAVEGYDPTGDMMRAQSNLDMVSSQLSMYDPETELAKAVDVALSKYDGSFSLTEEEILSEVNAFEDQSIKAMQREVSRTAAGFFDIQAVMSSQYGQAIALLEAARQREVSAFEATMRTEKRRDRMALVQSILQGKTQLELTKLRSVLAIAGMQMEQSKMVVMAMQDKINFDLEVESRDAVWDLELYPYRNAVMSSIAGSATVPFPTKWDRALQAAAVGFAGFGNILQILSMF